MSEYVANDKSYLIKWNEHKLLQLFALHQMAMERDAAQKSQPKLAKALIISKITVSFQWMNMSFH